MPSGTRAGKENGRREGARFRYDSGAIDQNVYFRVSMADQRDTTRLGS